MTEAQVCFTSVLRRYCVGRISVGSKYCVVACFACFLMFASAVSATGKSEPWQTFLAYCFVPLDGHAEFHTEGLRPVLNSVRKFNEGTVGEFEFKQWNKEGWDYSLGFVTTLDGSLKACGIYAPHEWTHQVRSDFDSFASEYSGRFEFVEDKRKPDNRLLMPAMPPQKTLVDKNWRKRTIQMSMQYDFNSVQVTAALVEREH